MSCGDFMFLNGDLANIQIVQKIVGLLNSGTEILMQLHVST